MAKHRQDVAPTAAARTPARHARTAARPHRRSSPFAITGSVAAAVALAGASLALTSRPGGPASTVATIVLAADALVAWLSIALTIAVGFVREQRRNASESGAVEEGTPTATHRASRPRPRVPWYAGVEVTFDLAA